MRFAAVVIVSVHDPRLQSGLYYEIATRPGSQSAKDFHHFRLEVDRAARVLAFGLKPAGQLNCERASFEVERASLQGIDFVRT
jgi:hypothetical protein